MTFDDLLTTPFCIREQNCFDLARIAWERLTGERLPDRGEMTSRSQAAQRVAEALPHYVRLHKPTDPCIVLMERPSLPNYPPHVGVYHEGSVLHHRPGGPRYEPLGTICARLGFTKISYWLPSPEVA